MRRTVESFYLDSKTDFYAPQVRVLLRLFTECGWTCRLEELLSCNTFCDFLFKLLNICLINVSVCKHVWGSQCGVFWTWGMKWKQVIPGVSLQILLVGLKINNCNVQSHFQVTEPEQQRKKKYNNSNNKSFQLTYLPGSHPIFIGADNPLFNPIIHSLLQTLSKVNNKIKGHNYKPQSLNKESTEKSSWNLKVSKVLFKRN